MYLCMYICDCVANNQMRDKTAKTASKLIVYLNQSRNYASIVFPSTGCHPVVLSYLFNLLCLYKQLEIQATLNDVWFKPTHADL